MPLSFLLTARSLTVGEQLQRYRLPLNCRRWSLSGFAALPLLRRSVKDHFPGSSIKP